MFNLLCIIYTFIDSILCYCQNSHRNHALLAKILWTLDVISNGRIELEIGAGWYEQEYKAYGYDYPSNASRIKQLDESLDIIKAMWTQRKKLLFQVNIIRSKMWYVILNPCKTSSYCNGWWFRKKYLLRVSAKHADRYNHYFGSPDEMKRKISILKSIVLL